VDFFVVRCFFTPPVLIVSIARALCGRFATVELSAVGDDIGRYAEIAK
jgi:hypothetical protein